MDLVRNLILEKLNELRLTRADVSARLDRNPTYLQQFLTKGSPRELPERERLLLAEILNVPEEKLRGPSVPVKARPYSKHGTSRESFVDTDMRVAATDAGAQARIIPSAGLYGNMDLPVYGTAQAGDEGDLLISEHPVDYVPRPVMLLRVDGAYGVIVRGDSMFPALRSGATALVHPHAPPQPEDLCVLRSFNQDGSVRVLIKEYRGETETGWKVRQYNPAKDFTLKKAEWQECQRVAGNYAP